jgi:peptide deformylase
MESTTAERAVRGRIERDPPNAEREQRRQMALRHVRQYPDPVLKRPTHEVSEFDGELEALVQRMWSIMDDAYGVGLAAPQLGLLLRVFTFRIDPDDEPGVVVNPKIEWASDEKEVEEEGCLSLGEVRVPVERSTSVKVSGKGVDGADLSIELEGFAARVFQHEIDHLDGTLMIDRTTDDAARREAMASLRPRP